MVVAGEGEADPLEAVPLEADPLGGDTGDVVPQTDRVGAAVVEISVTPLGSELHPPTTRTNPMVVSHRTAGRFRPVADMVRRGWAITAGLYAAPQGSAVQLHRLHPTGAVTHVE